LLDCKIRRAAEYYVAKIIRRKWYRCCLFHSATSDEGYIVAGSSNSTDGDVSGGHGGYDYWIVKLTTDGSIKWQESLGGSG